MEREPRCLGCLNFTGFAPVCPPDGYWDPDQEEEHVLTCRAFPEGIPDDVLHHRLPHARPLPGQQGSLVYEPREPATLNVPEVARLLGCSPSTVRRYLKDGLIWGVRRGRVWLICPEEVRLLRRPGSRAPKIPPGFFRPSGG